jgi:D-sedoheptulose 7-phosphate isomerase
MNKVVLKELKQKIQASKFVFVCGNGGSAATAEHLSNDLFSKGVMAICLNSNVSIVTMIGNDFGYEYAYSRQIDLYASKCDPSQCLLITISCSGTSPNIVNAITAAKRVGMPIFEFEVFSTDRDYGALENRHLEMVHEIKNAL